MDISTTYNGLKIKTPIIIGSSGLTNTVEKNQTLEENNAGAIVLKSIFEEQINFEVNKNFSGNYFHTEAFDYIKNSVENQKIYEYLDLIEGTKKNINIPVIASINCASPDLWTDFAEKIQNAGADAIELNISNLPSNIEKSSSDYEKIYFDIISNVFQKVNIPLSLKMNQFSAGLSNLIRKIDYTKKVKSFVLFNRFYSPDIDIENFKINYSNVFSSDKDYTIPLRWVALLSGKLQAELISSTGIHNAESLIKQILAGANAVQIVSVIYEKNPKYINVILDGLKNWMQSHNMKSLKDFKGKMNYSSIKNPSDFERIQFMKYYGGII